MKKVNKIFLIVSLIFFIVNIRVYAYEKISTNEEKEILTATYNVRETEEVEFLQLIKNNLKNGNKEYEFIKFDKVEDEQNSKEISEIITKRDLLDNNKDSIKELVPQIMKYSENGYNGEMSIVDIDIDAVDNGTYEELENLDIPFENVETNDLNNIDKEIEQNGKIYSLINVEWQNDEIREINGNIIPLTYKGIKHYQTIVEKENPNTYDATITYKGIADLDNKLYHYTVTYKEIVQDKVIEEVVEKDNNYIVPVVIVSAIGIVFITVLMFSKKRKKQSHRR